MFAISAEDCKELLDCCDLNVESYKESTRNVIEKVYAEAKPIIEISEESVEIIVDESADQVSDIEEPTEIIVEETQEINVEEVPERKRKRNHEVVLEESE